MKAINPGEVSQLYKILNTLVEQERMFTPEMLSILEKAGVVPSREGNDAQGRVVWVDEQDRRYTFSNELQMRYDNQRCIYDAY
tara:strand:- start:249 stop:497 length:249 start_codon:yes stop_codon:yes gene_type:complete